MEVYEKINLYLKDKKISKKEFARRLIELGVKLRNTGEIPSENTIYAYLNGRIGIKIELIPYIAEVLNIPEQLLFDDSDRIRKIYLTHILNSISTEEIQFLKSNLCDKEVLKEDNYNDKLFKIQDLLVYAPDIFLNKLEVILKDYRDLTLKLDK